MSDHSASPARPVSLFTIVCLALLFATFFFIARHYYKPAATSPQNLAAENLTKELEWRATPEARRKALADLRANEAKQVSGYAWIDQQAGKVQLPIERAMELTVQRYGAKK